MQNLFSKISVLFLSAFFLFPYHAYGQSCLTLKDIFENSAYCDKKEVFIHGKVYELLDGLTLRGSKYVYGFQITDGGQNIARVVSKDDMVLVKDSEVDIKGRYYKKLYANGLSLTDTVVVSSKDIKVIITAKELFNDILQPWGSVINEGETLRRRALVLAILIPLFSLGAFGLGYHIFYRRRQKRGIEFESYVENSFSRDVWEIEQKNTFRKLDRWVRSFANPDFVFVHRKTGKRLAVECKYKFSLPKNEGRIFWANEDQINNYQNFSHKEDIPVFVILGVGGSPKNPRKVFCVPLGQIKYPVAKVEYLEKFERDPKKSFFLDSGNNLI